MFYILIYVMAMESPNQDQTEQKETTKKQEKKDVNPYKADAVKNTVEKINQAEQKDFLDENVTDQAWRDLVVEKIVSWKITSDLFSQWCGEKIWWQFDEATTKDLNDLFKMAKEKWSKAIPAVSITLNELYDQAIIPAQKDFLETNWSSDIVNQVISKMIIPDVFVQWFEWKKGLLSEWLKNNLNDALNSLRHPDLTNERFKTPGQFFLMSRTTLTTMLQSVK